MELSPTEAALNAIAAIDLYKTDEKYDFKLSDILRRRQRPLLLMLDQSGNVLCSSESLDTPALRRQPPHDEPSWPAEAIDEAIDKVRDLFNQQAPASTVVEQLVINKPGERCALTVLANRFCCIRLFRLHSLDPGTNALYAALIESISKPQTGELDMNRVKGLFRLTNREAEVVDALMSGSTDKQIAIELAVSVETVRAYLKSIRAKLGVQTRTAIVSAVHDLQHGTSRKPPGNEN